MRGTQLQLLRDFVDFLVDAELMEYVEENGEEVIDTYLTETDVQSRKGVNGEKPASVYWS